MFHNVTCPACQHKYRLDEAEMMTRQVCPNCRSPFFAGKSVPDGRPATVAAAASPGAAAPPNYAKTMLTDQAPPIKYNCPRCGTPLQAEASEAGSKINCPKCTQRHQIPQPKPEAVAAVPNLNKTMLAGDESAAPRPPIKYNCPGCKKPLEAPAEQGGTKTNCPYCSQRLQIPAAPAAPNRNKTMLASDESAGPAGAAHGGYAAAPGAAPGQAPAAGAPQTLLTPLNVALGVIVLLLLFLLVPAFIRGGKEENKEFVKWQMELEKLKADIEAKRLEVEKQAKAAEEKQHLFDEQMRAAKAAELRQREEDRRRVQDTDDKEEKERREKRFKEEQARREQEMRDREEGYRRDLAALKAEQEKTKAALDASQKQQTVIQQAAPPPVVYVPPYNPYYYRPWGWW